MKAIVPDSLLSVPVTSLLCSGITELKGAIAMLSARKHYRLENPNGNGGIKANICFSLVQDTAKHCTPLPANRCSMT